MYFFQPILLKSNPILHQQISCLGLSIIVFVPKSYKKGHTSPVIHILGLWICFHFHYPHVDGCSMN